MLKLFLLTPCHFICISQGLHKDAAKKLRFDPTIIYIDGKHILKVFAELLILVFFFRECLIRIRVLFVSVQVFS